MIRTTVMLVAAAFAMPAAVRAQTPIDPCSLLTADQIKAVIQSPVEAGQPGVAKGSNECTWGDANGNDRVYIALRPAAEFRTMRSSIEKNGGHAIPVTGVGEDAFFVSPDESSSALYVLVRNHLLLLTVTLPESTQPESAQQNSRQQSSQAVEKVLAGQILPKL